MRAALDSNVIIYVEDMFADVRHAEAYSLLQKIAADKILIPLQAAGETLNWLIRKAKYPNAVAIEHVSIWTSTYHTQATTLAVYESGLDLVSHHQFQVWDAIILAAAAEANANVLLSEDMQHGFRWRGVTIVNPFLKPAHPLLKELLQE